MYLNYKFLYKKNNNIYLNYKFLYKKINKF